MSVNDKITQYKARQTLQMPKEVQFQSFTNFSEFHNYSAADFPRVLLYGCKIWVKLGQMKVVHRLHANKKLDQLVGFELNWD